MTALLQFAFVLTNWFCHISAEGCKMLQVFRQSEYSDASEMCSLLSSDDSDWTWICHIRITVIHIFSRQEMVTIVINELCQFSMTTCSLNWMAGVWFLTGISTYFCLCFCLHLRVSDVV